jgi:hypothetical protein
MEQTLLGYLKLDTNAAAIDWDYIEQNMKRTEPRELISVIHSLNLGDFLVTRISEDISGMQVHEAIISVTVYIREWLMHENIPLPVMLLYVYQAENQNSRIQCGAYKMQEV